MRGLRTSLFTLSWSCNQLSAFSSRAYCATATSNDAHLQPAKLIGAHARPSPPRVNETAVRGVVGEEQRPEMRTRVLRVGPAYHHELLTVQALDLAPEAAVAGLVGAVQPFRDDAFDSELAGIAIKRLSTHKMMFAVLQPGRGAREQRFKAFLPDPQRLAGQIRAIKEEEIEQHQDKLVGAASVRGRLHRTE